MNKKAKVLQREPVIVDSFIQDLCQHLASCE
jgi:hypothetical protein